MDMPQFLILDNDKTSVELIVEILEELGNYSYKVFSTPAKVLDYLENKVAGENIEPQAILCNVTMRGNDARELCDENSQLDIPFLFLSVLHRHEERRTCYLESDHPYITSPLTFDVIRTHIDKVIA